MTRLQHFFHDWSESFKTYYLSYLVALFATVLWIIIITYDNSYAMTSNTLYEFLATCGIAFPLFLLWPLYNQTRNKSDYTLVIISAVIGTVLSLLFAWYVGHHHIFSSQPEVESHIIVVLLSYLIAWGSILATVAYAHPHDNLTTRWRWKELFVHVVVAGLGSAILRGGISASLGSIDYLFDIDIDYKRYMYVGVVSFLIIGVSIFLTNLHRTKYEESYHSFFRFFGLYIFFPLAIVYACILLVYGGKIVITQTWPKGLISMMVIGYTIWGLIAYLLTYPLKESSLVNKMRSTYFISILVFVLLLFGAIGIRISQYGITESRYLIVMIGIWIVTVGITSLLRPKKTFSTMIFTLLWLAISSAYLPRGAAPIALHSQKNRLESLLEKNGFWDGNNLIVQEKNVDDLPEESQQELSQASNIVDYLTQGFGEEYLSSFYTNNTTWFQELLDSETRWNNGAVFIRQLWLTGELPWVNGWDILDSGSEYFNIYREVAQIDILPLASYTSLVKLSGYGGMAEYGNNTKSENGLDIVTQGEYQTLISFSSNGEKIVIDLNALAPEIYTLSKQQGEVQNYRLDFDAYSIIFNSIYGEKTWDTYKITWYEINLLIK